MRISFAIPAPAGPHATAPADDELRIGFGRAITLAGGTSIGILIATHLCCLPGAPEAWRDAPFAICSSTR